MLIKISKRFWVKADSVQTVKYLKNGFGIFTVTIRHTDGAIDTFETNTEEEAKSAVLGIVLDINKALVSNLCK